MFKEELLNLVDAWSVEQLENYIHELETRIGDTKQLLSALRAMRKRKTRKTVYENGPRDGR